SKKKNTNSSLTDTDYINTKEDSDFLNNSVLPNEDSDFLNDSVLPNEDSDFLNNSVLPNEDSNFFTESVLQYKSSESCVELKAKVIIKIENSSTLIPGK
ncbi:1118_t:CDS:1, partial [Scutellospora calospora]